MILPETNELAVLEQEAGCDGPTWFSEGYRVYDCERELVALTMTAAMAKYIAALRNAYDNLERELLKAPT